MEIDPELQFHISVDTSDFFIPQLHVWDSHILVKSSLEFFC